MCESVTRASCNDKKLVSVALTTYNGAKFLSPQLISIAKQSVAPAELVVCDDGSSDDTVAVLEKFANQARFPVRMYRNQRKLGFRANFMQCAQRCTGDLIAFCDQDDVWLPNKLEIQTSDFHDPDVMLSCHNAELVDQLGTRVDRRLDQYLKDSRLDFNTAGPTLFPRGFTQVIRKELVKWEWLREASVDIGDPSETMSHDGWFYFVALLHGLVVYHHEPLVEYRQHGENASGSVPSKRARFLARFSNRPADFQRLACVWTNRCLMLQRLLAEETALDEAVKRRAQLQLFRYNKSALAATDRMQFYAAETPFARLRILAQAVRRGDFKSRDPWLFPLEAVMKDAAYIFRGSSVNKPN